MVVTVFYHPADKLHGRIVFLLVMFPLGFYQYFIESIRSRRKSYLIRKVTGRMNQTAVFIIAYGRNNKGSFGTVCLEVKAAITSGSCSFGRIFQAYGYIR